MERKYYVIEGPEVEELCARIKEGRDRFAERAEAVMEKYQADSLLVRRSTTIVGLGFKTPGHKPGLKIDVYDSNGYYRAYPDRRTKIGKQLIKDMAAASAKQHPSDIILAHYKAARWAPTSDPRSRTGMSMAVSVGHMLTCGKRVTLDVPVVENEPFDPPAGAREIKKSEYIALTEEQ